MDSFERFEELTRVIEGMNREATRNRELPYIRLTEYVHYCEMKTFLRDYAGRLHLSPAERQELLRFFYEDTLRLRGRIGAYDLHAFTFHYFKAFMYRTGNLDTPDDCVEKLEIELIDEYRAAREKEARGEELTAEEKAIVERPVKRALEALAKE